MTDHPMTPAKAKPVFVGFDFGATPSSAVMIRAQWVGDAIKYSVVPEDEWRVTITEQEATDEG